MFAFTSNLAKLLIIQSNIIIWLCFEIMMHLQNRNQTSNQVTYTNNWLPTCLISRSIDHRSARIVVLLSAWQTNYRITLSIVWPKPLVHQPTDRIITAIGTLKWRINCFCHRKEQQHLLYKLWFTDFDYQINFLEEVNYQAPTLSKSIMLGEFVCTINYRAIVSFKLISRNNIIGNLFMHVINTTETFTENMILLTHAIGKNVPW